MERENLMLVPYPQQINFTDNNCLIKKDDQIAIPEKNKDKLFPIACRIKEITQMETNLDLQITIGQLGSCRKVINFREDVSLEATAYTLTISPEQIEIGYHQSVGAFYAVSTLKQLIILCGRELPCLQIEDYPDFAARGIMLDISRNKIPEMKTLYHIVDMMADLKLNQLQLYIEGFSFAYPSFPEVWQGGTPLNGEDIIKLDHYCRQNFVELVPNQNSFGHMQDWLARREFKDLAECPDGYQMEGFTEIRKPTTLNPLDPASLELVKDQYHDLLPNFSSDLFNVGCDETWELGQGKSCEACNEKGTGRVYLNFLLKIYDLVQEKGKKMMFWGDIIMQYPELIPELPSDIIALEWGYEGDHPFARDGKEFMESGIPFYVCPGTSSWNSIAGRTKNMQENLVNAAVNGHKYGAEGYLITDWGDYGHWQYLPVSYPGYTYGAALSWNVADNQDIDLASYLDKFVFQDNKGLMGQFVLNLGNYYLKEENIIHNNTNITRILYAKFNNIESIQDLSEEALKNVLDYVTNLMHELEQTEMNCNDASLVEDEFRNAIKMIQHGVDLGLAKFKISSEENDLDLKMMLERMIDEISVLIKNHQQLWLNRNRYSDLDESLEQFYKLKQDYLEYYRENF